MTCWSCLNGHRASTCQHSTRPLYALKNKGRPRPQGFSRSKEHPDILSLDDPSFATFYQTIMNDPILRKEYFHAEDPAKSPRGKRNIAPYVKRSRSRERGDTIVDIYSGVCSDEEIIRWRECCGVTTVTFNDKRVIPKSLPAWPTWATSHTPRQPRQHTNFESTESTQLTESTQSATLSKADTSLANTEGVVVSPSSDFFIMPTLPENPNFALDDFPNDMSPFNLTQLESPIMESENLVFSDSEITTTATEDLYLLHPLLHLPTNGWESELESSGTTLYSELFGDGAEENNFSIMMDFESVIESC